MDYHDVHNNDHGVAQPRHPSNVDRRGSSRRRGWVGDWANGTSRVLVTTVLFEHAAVLKGTINRDSRTGVYMLLDFIAVTTIS